MATPRILVLGGTGMLGHKVVQTLAPSFETSAAVRRGRALSRLPGIDRVKILEGVDVTQQDAVAAMLAAVKPAVIVNCIGVVKQLAAAKDPVPSLTINSLLPHRLAALARLGGARLIHISTDCVFSGRKGMYQETDVADAEDLYGRSKLLGEVGGEQCLTLRTSIIGRELESANGLVEWFLSQRGGRVKGYSTAIFSGLTTIALAQEIHRVIAEFPGLNGLYQVSVDAIDKATLLGLLRSAFHAAVEVIPDGSLKIDRSLVSTRYRQATGFTPPSWSRLVEEMAADARLVGYDRRAGGQP